MEINKAKELSSLVTELEMLTKFKEALEKGANSYNSIEMTANGSGFNNKDIQMVIPNVINNTIRYQLLISVTERIAQIITEITDIELKPEANIEIL